MLESLGAEQCSVLSRHMAKPANSNLGIIKPFVGSEGIGAEVTYHASIGAGIGTRAPRRHAVQYQPVRDKGLAGPGMQLDPLAFGEGLLAGGMVSLGNILFPPLLRRQSR